MAKRNIELAVVNDLGMKEIILGEGANEKKLKRKRKPKKDESFKDTLKNLLSLETPPEAMAEILKTTPLGSTMNYREAILLAQIIKAYNGDTQAAVFVRDSSGNKLKDGEKEEKKKKFEDFF